MLSAVAFRYTPPGAEPGGNKISGAYSVKFIFRPIDLASQQKSLYRASTTWYLKMILIKFLQPTKQRESATKN